MTVFEKSDIKSENKEPIPDYNMEKLYKAAANKMNGASNILRKEVARLTCNARTNAHNRLLRKEGKTKPKSAKKSGNTVSPTEEIIDSPTTEEELEVGTKVVTVVREIRADDMS
jgi:hypothetical protein